jgi:shikimate kinase
MKSVILFGYMCAGKTTVGKALARSLGRTFYDLDWYIEERYHKRIPDIFAEKGEEGFRDIERRMLHEVAQFEDIVLACGGGTPCFFDNADFCNGAGTTIFLKASPATIIAHLRLSHTVRPLLKGKQGPELQQFIEAQLAERTPHYAKAQLCFNVDVLDDYKKINQLVEHIKENLIATENGKMEN